MKLSRMFTQEKFKGQMNYLTTQKKYEILRTCLYFAIALSLFLAGIYQTGSRRNLLTIIAVLGCLPASKSAVSMIMFLRYKSCPKEDSERIEAVSDSEGLYDLVFTSYETNFYVPHLTVKGNTVCGYMGVKSFEEKKFANHMQGIFLAENLKEVQIKIFPTLEKYLERLEQLQTLKCDETNTQKILQTIKNVTL